MKSPIFLNALRAFEASARHQSFSSAANELHVTPAAVSQLVRTLEEWLGAPLFLRGISGKTRLIVTQAGERALPDIRAGLELMAQGLERLKEESIHVILTVTVSPAFATKWLLPRIDKFYAAWPTIDVHLDTNLKAVDFITQRVDIGIRYGLGNWSGLSAEKLMNEDIYPVCSPNYLRDGKRLGMPTDLLKESLIHDLSMEDYANFPSWEMWLNKAGVENTPTAHGMMINNSAAVLQAAIEGVGVALARGVMVRDDLAAGRLIRLFPEINVTSDLAYYVIYRPECVSLPRVVAFREWLFSEAGVNVMT